MTKKRDVLGLGCATVDDLLFVEEFPSPDAKTRVLKSERQGGGLTATALVAAARLGAKCAYGGQLGRDEISLFAAKVMENEGIDLSLTSWSDEAAAIHSLIIVDQTHHTRNIFFQINGAVGPALDAPSETEILASRVLFVDHYGAKANLRAIEIARMGGVPVVADFERSNVPEWENFFPLIDHLIISRDFACQLTKENSPQKAAQSLWTSDREVVVVTDGENGCWSVENGEKAHHVPAFETETVDTTGCGDVFHGVYAAALAWRWPLEKRLRWASAAAALKARQSGAQKGIPRREQVETFVGA